eukprot:TRINITY_DN36604_c0_g1_i1.p1 TRINITY_DN36604_c0_g1~~TRINITY_DN36604_c0_g1_i1.p1  ORF type:complete len:290 (+),score=60.22 TRINITY_DN36604_c0_g1_i1:64-870(+)
MSCTCVTAPTAAERSASEVDVLSVEEKLEAGSIFTVPQRESIRDLHAAAAKATRDPDLLLLHSCERPYREWAQARGYEAKPSSVVKRANLKVYAVKDGEFDALNMQQFEVLIACMETLHCADEDRELGTLSNHERAIAERSFAKHCTPAAGIGKPAPPDAVLTQAELPDCLRRCGQPSLPTSTLDAAVASSSDGDQSGGLSSGHFERCLRHVAVTPIVECEHADEVAARAGLMQKLMSSMPCGGSRTQRPEWAPVADSSAGDSVWCCS